MKQKKLFKQLILSKQTVACLNEAEMSVLGAGVHDTVDSLGSACPHYTQIGPDCITPNVDPLSKRPTVGG